MRGLCSIRHALLLSRAFEVRERAVLLVGKVLGDWCLCCCLGVVGLASNILGLGNAWFGWTDQG